MHHTESIKNSFFFNNWKKIHSWTYYVSLILFSISLPTSEFGMSLTMFVLFGNWLLDIFLSKHLYNVPLDSKLKLFWQNKAAVVLFSLLLIHAVGILYSEDIKHAIKDIRIKIPIGVFALVVASEKKLTVRQLRTILLFFILTVFTSSIICFTFYKTNKILNIRDISLFISHIRFGLMISFSIFLVFYIIKKDSYSILIKISLVIISIWLFYYLIATENITGLVISVIVEAALLSYVLVKSKNKIVKFSTLLILLSIPVLAYFFVTPIYKDVYNIEPIDLKALDKHTASGNKYRNDTTNKQTENGHYVWIYFCEKELKKQWPKYSSIKFYGKDNLNQDIRFTLYRYLTSKGLRKDSIGLNKLQKTDIQAIENGIPNYKFTENSNLRNRFHKILWELKRYSQSKNPSGHSVAMRLEFWKTGINIIKEYPIFGVGTGDIYLEYDKKYVELKSRITQRWRFLSHNQFIYTTVILGFIGLLWFLFVLLYPAIRNKKIFFFPYTVFFLIVFLSFFTEDTLTTQPGVCFFAFFSSLLLFNPIKEQSEKNNR